MKKLLLGFLLLLIAIGLGYSIQQDPGYLLIYYHHWSLSTSLWAAIISLVIILGILYYIVKLTQHFLSIRSHLGHWSHSRKHKKALSDFDKGLCQILQSDWKNAASTFNKSFDHSPSPLINTYFSILAANQLDDKTQIENYFKKSSILSSTYNIPLHLLKVQIQIQNNQWHEALNTLDYLYQQNPKNPATLLQLSTVLTHLEKWDRLASLLPEIEKYTHTSKKAIQQLYETIYSSRLLSLDVTAENSHGLINNHWTMIPKNFQKRPKLFHTYIEQLIKSKDSDKASQLIEEFLSKDWYSPLTITYGLIVTQDTPQRILVTEKWLTKHPQDANLLLCLGRLYCQEKIWAKANSHMLQSYQLNPNREILLELSLIAELTGKHQEALDYLKKLF